MKGIKLSKLFFVFMLIGSIAITLSALNIGRDFISDHIYWFVIPLWIGMIGYSIIEKQNKKQKKQ
ncbi:hypothetical protein [Ornithinibacillus halotolerans]|uniref:Uncharacterized protein n=1 Tax=Ornithinibacillus halotolerans TaxID=1274357 RepID=A0A916W8N0_9BACI|nr:hypothetical protein [Ornithinibacillus halotolerans]GGA76366.1 hypothetical protein GCM10008025_19960 [Ornithinibacillus halotolerans]